jgi:sialate O-acetylesterase
MRRSIRVATFTLCLFAAATLHAEVKLNSLFSDHMVLQQAAKVPVWGTATKEGEQVQVSFQGQQKTTQAKNGRWIVELENLKPGEPATLTIAGENTVQIADVLVGEVWLASGQSNMVWTVSKSSDAPRTIANARHPRMRLFSVGRQSALTPQNDAPGQWSVCSPETIGEFSAVAYSFGLALQEHLDVPIGLINSSYGGTPAEAWTSREGLMAAEELRALAVKGPDLKNKNAPTGLFNAMIHPLVPFAIKGVIWYQGESNAPRAWQYRTLFPALIADWRQQWKREDLAFLFVQLAPFRDIVREPAESNWAELREAQLLTAQTVPNTFMAVITDLGEEKDIHPKQKVPIGQRLALAARAIVYGEKTVKEGDQEKPLVYSGPLYKEYKVQGDRMVIQFDHAGTGLVAKGSELAGLSIAGEDRKFVNAYAQIKETKPKEWVVEVWHPEIPRPAAVRYGWANYPTGNLWNQEGLPASPFRTDEFPLTTQTSR